MQYTHCVAFVVLDNRTNQHAQRSGALSTYVDFVLLVTILKTLTEDVVSQFLQFRQVLDVCCVARHGEELQVLFSVHGGGEGPLQGQILVGTYYAQVRGSMAREPGVQVTRRTCASAPTAALVGVKWGAFAAPQLFGRSARLLSDQRVLWPFLLLKRNAPWAVKTLQAENGEGVMVTCLFRQEGVFKRVDGGWVGGRGRDVISEKCDCQMTGTTPFSVPSLPNLSAAEKHASVVQTHSDIRPLRHRKSRCF